MVSSLCVVSPALFCVFAGTSISAGLINARIRRQLSIDDLPSNLILLAHTIRRMATTLQSNCLASGVPGRSAFGMLDIDSLLSKQTCTRGVEACVGEQPVHILPKTALPFWLYLLITLLMGLAITSTVPLVIWLTLSLMSLIQAHPTSKSGFWGFLIGPAIYYAILLAMFLGLPALKWLMFPFRMRPGIYPLHGWTYLR